MVVFPGSVSVMPSAWVTYLATSIQVSVVILHDAVSHSFHLGSRKMVMVLISRINKSDIVARACNVIDVI